MRISSYTIYDQITRSLQRSMEEFARLENMMASGRKINRPSDDVTGTLKSMDYTLDISGSEQYRANILAARTYLSAADRVFSSFSDSLSKLKDLVTNAISAPMTSDAGAVQAGEAAAIRDLLLDLSNSKTGSAYLFSGFRTDTAPIDNTTFAYKGDQGIRNTIIEDGSSMPVNFSGNEAFSYTLEAPEVVNLSNGGYAHYSQGPGTTINVEIRGADDTTVLDTFSFSNFVQLADQVKSAFETNDAARLEALTTPLSDARNHILEVQAAAGARVGSLDERDSQIAAKTVDLQNALSAARDADLTETITELQQESTAMAALRETARNLLSKSLIDYLG